MTIVEKIKKLANERKITLAELERRTNLSNGTIRRWDDKTPGVDKVKKVADYFDVSIDYLLGRVESPIETVAAHHDGEEWTTEELEEIEKFLQFIKSKREQN
ncbi:helix-turn-helix transcriptional regulator [Bacillus sp. FSL W7-1034]|uniref:helix-turn-helix domain-containing protein n=1 Tax=Bacillus TaxID=1386 RepID=UPI000D03C4B3|nr:MULTISPECIES: helix-turn-helix transcriptional regulator [Bacillus]WOQ72360.1 helix-turn-helix transcriptional regulator [Bacillus stratosphericus]MCI9883858.1 helix-turn-helix transcriptional regulator [Bacillus altitudinis]MCY7629148.1 helix-turn-helix transcriptional regulator [Bacillus altitudinis]MDH3097598.1 helix-turn-helix transcriptional regulator [Bacillus safensis]MDX2363422.1 helix-turn-helix transcriptional regulator [Bacillus altitudinis]